MFKTTNFTVKIGKEMGKGMGNVRDIIIKTISKNNNKNLYKPLELFDVTLRDGIQFMKEIIPFEKKIDMYNKILINCAPTSVEIGSLVSPKVVPQMKDTIELYKYAKENSVHIMNYTPDLYVLVPPYEKYIEKAKTNNIENISITSSVSNEFQKKNVKIDLKDTYEIIKKINGNDEFNNIKVYLSCINYCPVLKRKVNFDNILNEIKLYNSLNIKEICLSDTAGTLSMNDMRELFNRMKNNGILFDNISLHLHKNKSSLLNNNVVELAHYAMKKGIKKFDVSIVNTGGCHMTLNKDELSPNMSYKDIYNAYNMLIYPTTPMLGEL